MQNTRFEQVRQRVTHYLLGTWIGTWRRRSLALITLLIGFYLGSNLTVYYLQKIGQRPLVVLAMVVIVELLVRLRDSVHAYPWPMSLVLLDNLRIGAVYAVVLEAYKLGS